MRYAVLDGGQIVAERTIVDWNEYPEHKRAARDERGDGGPVLRPIVVEGDGPNEQRLIESHSVRIIKTQPPPPSLAAVRADYTARVKDAARAVRDAVRTPGKDMVYSEKKDQAHAVIAMGKEAANALENNGAAQFPLLAGTVGIEAPTLFDLAELVWSKYEMWNALSYHIERAEASGTKAISDASDAASVQAAYEAITWPTLP